MDAKVKTLMVDRSTLFKVPVLLESKKKKDTLVQEVTVKKIRQQLIVPAAPKWYLSSQRCLRA